MGWTKTPICRRGQARAASRRSVRLAVRRGCAKPAGALGLTSTLGLTSALGLTSPTCPSGAAIQSGLVNQAGTGGLPETGWAGYAEGRAAAGPPRPDAGGPSVG